MDTLAKIIFFLRGFGRTRDRRDSEEAARWPSLRSKKGLLKSSCLELAEVRVEGGKGHQRHGWVLESLVRHQGRPKGTSTGGGDPPRDGNALSEREPKLPQSVPPSLETERQSHQRFRKSHVVKVHGGTS